MQENILFGRPYDPILYRKVLEACSLDEVSSVISKSQSKILLDNWHKNSFVKLKYLKRMINSNSKIFKCKVYILWQQQELKLISRHCK